MHGDKVALDYNNSSKKSAYHLLSEKDKDIVKNVVYIMDSFCVSDVAYHELSMVDHDGLPRTRSYLIKQCRQDLYKLCSMSRTPGEWPGAQLSFKDGSSDIPLERTHFHAIRGPHALCVDLVL